MVFKKGIVPWNKGKKGLQVSCNKGKHPTKKTRKRMSESQLGEKNHFYDKHHTKETKNRLSVLKFRQRIMEKILVEI